MRRFHESGEFLGQGSEKAVSVDAEHKDRVIARWRKETVSPEEAKASFYYGKLVHLLFPDNTPDVYEAGFDNSAYLNVQRITPDQGHIRAQSIMDNPSSSSGEHEWAMEHIRSRRSDPKVQELFSQMRKAGLNPSDSGLNYVFEQNSENIVYLDTPYAFELQADPWGTYALEHFDRVGLQAIIQQLPQEKRSIAQNYLEKIIKLEEALIKKYPKKLAA